MTKQHLFYVDAGVFIASFQICPYIHLKGLRKNKNQIGISGIQIEVLTEYLPNKMQIQLTYMMASENLTGMLH
jgi:hypothetical protein